MQAATRTIPIVFIQAPKPVELGLVASLARPGGNTTGFAQMSAELDAERLELLHEIVPSLARAAFLINPDLLPGIEERFAGAEVTAKSLGIDLKRVAATAPAELNAALAAVREPSSQALLIQNDPMLSGTERSGRHMMIRGMPPGRRQCAIFVHSAAEMLQERAATLDRVSFT